jgi:hypothetical protein
MLEPKLACILQVYVGIQATVGINMISVGFASGQISPFHWINAPIMVMTHRSLDDERSSAVPMVALPVASKKPMVKEGYCHR